MLFAFIERDRVQERLVGDVGDRLDVERRRGVVGRKAVQLVLESAVDDQVRGFVGAAFHREQAEVVDGHVDLVAEDAKRLVGAVGLLLQVEDARGRLLAIDAEDVLGGARLGLADQADGDRLAELEALDGAGQSRPAGFLRGTGDPVASLMGEGEPEALDDEAAEAVLWDPPVGGRIEGDVHLGEELGRRVPSHQQLAALGEIDPAVRGEKASVPPLPDDPVLGEGVLRVEGVLEDGRSALLGGSRQRHERGHGWNRELLEHGLSPMCLGGRVGPDFPATTSRLGTPARGTVRQYVMNIYHPPPPLSTEV